MNQRPTEELKKNSVTYILGQLTQQVSDLADKIKDLTDGTYQRITNLEQTKADRAMTDKLQKLLDDDIEVRLVAVEKLVIPSEKQDSIQTSITWLKVTVGLFGVALAACLVMLVYHLFHSPL